jgi:fatty-acid desaturase
MLQDRSTDYLKHHLVITMVLIAINIVFLVQAASDHDTFLVVFWSVLAAITLWHAASCIAGLRHQADRPELR